MKKGRMAVFCFLLSMSLLSGCNLGEISTEQALSTEDEQSSSYLYGKITSLDESRITIALVNQEDAQEAEDLNLSGKSKTITIGNKTVIMIDGKTAEMDDLEEGNMITVEMSGDTVVSITSGIHLNWPDISAVKEFTDEQDEDDQSYLSEMADVAAVLCSDGGLATITNGNIEKSGDTTNLNNSELYGVNAGLAATANGRIDLSDSQVETDGLGSQSVFSIGEDSLINLSNVILSTAKDNSNGIQAAYGGKIVADTVDITTQGNDSSAAAIKYGNATINITNGILNTSGQNSPCIYSAGTVAAEKTEGTASNSPMIVEEGGDSITLSQCNLAGGGFGQVENAGIVMYGNTTSDTEDDPITFLSEDSKLAVLSDSYVYDSAPMFYITNANAAIQLTNTELSYGSEILLKVSGNSQGLGTKGANGGNVSLNGVNQIVKGEIIADNISAVSVSLIGSTFEGAINTENAAKEADISIDKDSTWTVTADSYVTVFANGDESCANIISNGYTVYYDADNDANTWLNGRTIELSDKGTIQPAK